MKMNLTFHTTRLATTILIFFRKPNMPCILFHLPLAHIETFILTLHSNIFVYTQLIISWNDIILENSLSMLYSSSFFISSFISFENISIFYQCNKWTHFRLNSSSYKNFHPLLHRITNIFNIHCNNKKCLLAQ